MKKKLLQQYDSNLIILTALILTGIGITCLYGITYYNYNYTPQWTTTPAYSEYITAMNLYIYPFIILLLAAIGLCIPKRIIPRERLITANTTILIITVLLALFDLTLGIGFLLLTMILLQSALAVLILTKHGRTYFEKQDRTVQFGSTLLHLGIVLFIFDFAILPDSTQHLKIFWISTLLITTGCILCFYPEQLKKLRNMNLKITD